MQYRMRRSITCKDAVIKVRCRAMGMVSVLMFTFHCRAPDVGMGLQWPTQSGGSVGQCRRESGGGCYGSSINTRLKSGRGRLFLFWYMVNSISRGNSRGAVRYIIITTVRISECLLGGECTDVMRPN